MNNSHSFSLEERNDLYEYNMPSINIEEEENNISSVIINIFRNNNEKEIESPDFNAESIYFNTLSEKNMTKAEKVDKDKNEESNMENGGDNVSKKNKVDQKFKEQRRMESEKTASSTEKTESKTSQLNGENKITEEKDLNDNKENKKEINKKDEADNINLEQETILNNINNNINNDLSNNTYISNKNSDEKKMLSKKRKKKLLKGDNLIKNIRATIIKYITDFINEKIRILLNNKIGKSNCIKQFLQIAMEKLYHSKVDDDKNFLKIKLKDIFSFKISGKYTNYLDEHNKKLVEYLIIHEKTGKYFKSLFDLSFLNCLDHINGKNNYNLLDGLAKVNQIIEKEEKDLDEYEKEYYKNFLNDYENIINDKNSRKARKKI